MLPHLFNLCLVITITMTACADEMSCNWSRDCQQYDHCANVADASCVCNFGKCVLSGNPFFRGSECNDYKECKCSYDPDNCKCEDGFCREGPVECHKPEDCLKMKKCNGKDCNCSGNLCEWQCDTDPDCKDFYCNTALGYQCKCQKSLCEFVKKPKECKTIDDCVKKGLCGESSPCDCTQEYCETPHWVREGPDGGNCRKDVDCERSILTCRGGKCVCGNKKDLNPWEKIGTCEKKSTVPDVKFPGN